MAPVLEELTVAADPDAWRRAGFEVDGDECITGSVRFRLAGAGAVRGLTSWSLRGLEGSEGGDRSASGGQPTLDGLPVPQPGGAQQAPAGGRHPNGVTGLDHVVAFSPDLDRTVAALETAGLDLRRIREGPTPGGAMRQAFFRLGAPLLEVIEAPPDSPMRGERRAHPAKPGASPSQRPDAGARLWGLAFLVDQLDDCARIMGDHLGEPRDAVQEGRRIVSARRSAGLGAPVAFISPVNTL